MSTFAIGETAIPIQCNIPNSLNCFDFQQKKFRKTIRTDCFRFGGRIALHILAMSEETNKDAQQEAKKSNSLVLILGAALVLIVGGGGGWFYLHQGKTAQASAPQPEQLHTVHLEGFTVNLADVEENHFLRITIDLGLGHAPKTAKEGESEIPTARVRDAILTVLTAEKPTRWSQPTAKRS